jgi:hypothetical protein
LPNDVSQETRPARKRKSASDEGCQPFAHTQLLTHLRAPGFIISFTAIALAALSVEQDLGRYVVAAGWIGHAAWDLAHFRADKVVSRSFAEWCAVFDVLRAVAILFLPLG